MISSIQKIGNYADKQYIRTTVTLQCLNGSDITYAELRWFYD